MIPIGDGNFIKIPKPFEFGALGTILTSFLETLDNEKDADEFFLTTWTILKQQARLSYVPQLVAPIYNTALNKTFFGSPVVSENMKHSLPDYGQSYPWSSNVITSAIENAPPNIRKYLMSGLSKYKYHTCYQLNPQYLTDFKYIGRDGVLRSWKRNNRMLIHSRTERLRKLLNYTIKQINNART